MNKVAGNGSILVMDKPPNGSGWIAAATAKTAAFFRWFNFKQGCGLKAFAKGYRVKGRYSPPKGEQPVWMCIDAKPIR
ncbi:MAG: hypothetical protein ACE37E_12005 [Hyphomicrobiales bacterium]